MLIASRISYLEGHISQKYLNSIENLLEIYEFDLSKSQYQYNDLKPFIFRDKKVRSGKLNLVLLGGPSKAIITNSFDSNNLKKVWLIKQRLLWLLSINPGYLMQPVKRAKTKAHIYQIRQELT